MSIVKGLVSAQVLEEIDGLVLQETSDRRLSGHQLELSKLSPEARRIAGLLDQLPGGEVVLLRLDISDVARTKRAALKMVALIGEAVQVESQGRQFWYSLGVDPNAAAVAANGTGPNVPHIDMLTFSAFPTGMAILCERPDPTGGGRTVLADIGRAVARLSPREVDALRAKVFSYWRDDGLINVGEHLELFPVLPEAADGRVRFTSKMPARIAKVPLPKEAPAGAESAVLALIAALDAERMTLHLTAGDLVLFSQLHYCHGRSELGEGADQVATHLRRQLWRLYFNMMPPPQVRAAVLPRGAGR